MTQSHDDASEHPEYIQPDAMDVVSAGMPGDVGMVPVPSPGGMTGGGLTPEAGPAVEFDAWNYRSEATPTGDLEGYHVEATDGRIGKVSTASHIADDGYLLVDTGPWIFGRTVVLPAATVSSIDPKERVVHIDRTKQEVKDAPSLGSDEILDETVRTDVHTYYHAVRPTDY